jgi:signal transduction histidine kinase
MRSNPFKGLTHRSLRARVTVVATVVLAAGLLLGTLGLARLFVAARVAAVDKVVRAQTAQVGTLAGGDDLPSPLPPAASGTALEQVLDPAGTVLDASAAAPAFLEMVPVDQSGPLTKERVYTTSATTLGKGSFRVDLRPATYKGHPVVVVVAVPFSDVADTLAALHRVILVVLPIVLLAAAIATWLAVGSTLRPVDELRAEADTVVASGGSVAPRLAIPAGAVELRRLGETLNRMLERVHGAGEQQRAFVADAAHELRSPLASILTQLEVAMATPTTADEWPQIAADVYADAERLRRIADDLLLLARLDAGQPEGSNLVDVVALLGGTGTPLEVEGDAQALGRLFDNLMTNARKYADTVHVAAKGEASSVVVTIDDDGPGVPRADRERVFQRFVRLDSARSRGEGGTGLGLAIARAIARSHRGDVLLGDSPLGGLRATVWLPLAVAPERPPRAGRPPAAGFTRRLRGNERA